MGYIFERKTDNVDDVMAADINELQAAIEAPKYLQESGGPTVLEIGAVADGEFLKRNGNNVVGAIPTPETIVDSWIEVTGWSYYSSTQITVPSGAENIYAVGDQIRLKQGGAYKYFSVIAVADTLLTVTGGSDYSVANASITDAAFSKGGGVGHPGWFNWIPIFQGFSVDPPGTFRYMIIGKMCYVTVRMDDGTSNGNIFRFNTPTVVSDGVDFYYNSLSYMVNGATIRFGFGMVQVRSKSVTDPNMFFLSTETGATGWTTSGAKRGNFQVVYEIG